VSSSCIFCRIATREIPSGIVYEDDEIVAFRDLNPQAPAHVLVIPKRHVAALDDAVEGDAKLLGAMLLIAKRVAAALGLSGGYRVVTNIGPDGGQSVSHLHLHVLGGRPMAWPPG
jgi:histidine triad (HIT) family protein